MRCHYCRSSYVPSYGDALGRYCGSCIRNGADSAGDRPLTLAERGHGHRILEDILTDRAERRAA